MRNDAGLSSTRQDSEARVRASERPILVNFLENTRTSIARTKPPGTSKDEQVSIYASNPPYPAINTTFTSLSTIIQKRTNVRAHYRQEPKPSYVLNLKPIILPGHILTIFHTQHQNALLTAHLNILTAILVIALCYPELLDFIMCELRCEFGPVACVVGLEPVMGFKAAVLTCRSTWGNCHGSVCAAK